MGYGFGGLGFTGRSGTSRVGGNGGVHRSGFTRDEKRPKPYSLRHHPCKRHRAASTDTGPQYSIIRVAGSTAKGTTTSVFGHLIYLYIVYNSLKYMDNQGRKNVERQAQCREFGLEVGRLLSTVSLRVQRGIYVYIYIYICVQGPM